MVLPLNMRWLIDWPPPRLIGAGIPWTELKIALSAKPGNEASAVQLVGVDQRLSPPPSSHVKSAEKRFEGIRAKESKVAKVAFNGRLNRALGVMSGQNYDELVCGNICVTREV